MPVPQAASFGFVTWDRDDPTGGNVYNHNLVAELRALGTDLRLHKLAGTWPEGDATTHAKLARALRSTPASLVDGIVASGSPEVIVAAVESGHAVTILIHMPISDEVGLEPARRHRYAALEAKSVRAASGVLCSSRWSAAEILRRYGRTDVGVALPGVTPAAVAQGSRDSDQGPAHSGAGADTGRGPSVDGYPGRLRPGGSGLCRSATCRGRSGWAGGADRGARHAARPGARP